MVGKCPLHNGHPRSEVIQRSADLAHQIKKVRGREGFVGWGLAEHVCALALSGYDKAVGHELADRVPGGHDSDAVPGGVRVRAPTGPTGDRAGAAVPAGGAGGHDRATTRGGLRPSQVAHLGRPCHRHDGPGSRNRHKRGSAGQVGGDIWHGGEVSGVS